MKRCLTAILLLSLMLLLTACLPVPKHTETPAQTATETAKPTALTPTPATSYEVTMQRATTWVSGTGSQWVQVVAAIENTGSANLYLSSGAYDLEDASGALVGCGSMVPEYPNVLAPGQKVGFELSVMELPESLLEQVADCRVWAYPVQYNW